MNTKFFWVFLLTLVSISGTEAQKIEMKKIFGGYQFSQICKNLTMGKLVSVMETNSEAFPLIKSARSNATLASVIGAIGGGLIGWPLGTAIGGGDPEWALAGIGAVLVGVSIPISTNANKKAKKAVELYNAGLSFNDNYRPRLGIKANGNSVGVVVNF